MKPQANTHKLIENNNLNNQNIMKNNTHKINQEPEIDSIELVKQLLQTTVEFVVLGEGLKEIISLMDKSADPSAGQIIRNIDNKFFDPGIKQLYEVTQNFFNDIGKTPFGKALDDFGVPTDDLPNELIEKPLSDFKPPEDESKI